MPLAGLISFQEANGERWRLLGSQHPLSAPFGPHYTRIQPPRPCWRRTPSSCFISCAFHPGGTAPQPFLREAHSNKLLPLQLSLSCRLVICYLRVVFHCSPMETTTIKQNLRMETSQRRGGGREGWKRDIHLSPPLTSEDA